MDMDILILNPTPTKLFQNYCSKRSAGTLRQQQSSEVEVEVQVQMMAQLSAATEDCKGTHPAQGKGKRTETAASRADETLRQFASSSRASSSGRMNDECCRKLEGLFFSKRKKKQYSLYSLKKKEVG